MNLRRTIVYSILTALITISYLLMVVFAERMTQGYFGYRSVIFALAMAFVIAVLFIPVKNMTQRFADRAFFHGTESELAKKNALLLEELKRSEKLKAIATVAAGMAHEIKNPLTSIAAFAEYLKEKRNDDEYINKFQNVMREEVGRINNIVQQVLDFAKPLPPRLEKVDANKVLDATLDFLSNKFLSNKIRVSKDYEGDAFIMADAEQLKQIFLNIFLNAIDAMAGGGDIFVGMLFSKDAHHKQILNISIQDTGCGIAPNVVDCIFDPFYTTKDSGTGLGLAIVHGIVKEHGGKILVESVPQKGTKFTISFPIANLG